ncbi:MAG: hypothetical protein DDT19_02313 [Syntrophomonadaceae bacterium]|nr:hypothetical protein [Bacillota bacterium]
MAKRVFESLKEFESLPKRTVFDEVPVVKVSFLDLKDFLDVSKSTMYELKGQGLFVEIGNGKYDLFETLRNVISYYKEKILEKHERAFRRY